MNYWLVKQEPQTYALNNLMKDKETSWEGVRNYQARNNLNAMQLNDQVLFYHSGKEKAVVGIAAVSKESYPDPTSEGLQWTCVDIKFVKKLVNPVPLSKIKSIEALNPSGP